MDNKFRKINLHRVIADALAAQNDAGSIRRVIPIAWPVLEIQHKLRIRVQERLSLVERHVLEAVSAFGPVRDQEIAIWMGLPVAVVQHVVESLGRFPGVVSRADGLLSAAEGTLDRCTHERWVYEVVQEFGFLVNGVTGGLASQAINEMPQNFQLRIDISNGKGCVLDRSGSSLDKVFWIASSTFDARNDLLGLVCGSDAAERAVAGVPEGAFQVESEQGCRTGVRWVLALGLLGADGQMVVYPAGRPNIELLRLDTNLHVNFERLLRRGFGTGTGLFTLVDGESAEKEIPEEWARHARCEARDQRMVISITHPTVFDHWAESSGDRDSARDPESQSGQSPMPPALWNAIGSRHIWHPYFFTVRKVVPGDLATAEIMLKQQALHELEGMADSNDGVVDLESWWESAMKTLGADWPENVRPHNVSLSDLLSIARRSPNPDLVDFIM